MSNKKNPDIEPKYLIIPAAGLGTRMKSVNPDLPKELLPVGHKPAIQYAVEEGLSAGIINVIIIINRLKEIIREYFEEEKVSSTLFPGAADEMKRIRQNMCFHFLYQKEPLGEADALQYAEGIAGTNAVAVMYPDNIYLPSPGAMKIIKSVYVKFRHDVIALSRVPDDCAPAISNSGRVDIAPVEENLFNIEKFVSKGQGQFVPRFRGEMRASGIYICGPYLFKYIKKARSTTGEGEFTDTPVRNMILKERTMLGYHLPGIVYDIGNPHGYELCLKNIQKRDSRSD
jgi:UTP--glucose-1-phosphate uridylyltransferase